MKNVRIFHGFVIYGESSMNIAKGEEMTHCPYCGCDSTADVFVYGKYFHVFWLPFFPINKDVDLTCHRCGGKRIGPVFKKSLFKYPKHLSMSYRYRWYSYIGVLLVVSSLILVFIADILKALQK